MISDCVRCFFTTRKMLFGNFIKVNKIRTFSIANTLKIQGKSMYYEGRSVHVLENESLRLQSNLLMM